MTKEELIEMIDATINENGSRNITGKTLNLALTEIVNAMGTGSGSGSLTLYFAAGQETEEQKTANIVVREQCRIIAEAGGAIPTINVDMTQMYASLVGPGLSMSYVALSAAFDTTGALTGGGAALLVSIYEGGQSTIIVNEDGTTSLNEDGTTSPMNGMSTMSLRQ